MYRNVKCVELHDARLAIHIKGEEYPFSAPIGRTEDAARPEYKIKLADLWTLLESLGYESLQMVGNPYTDQSLPNTDKTVKVKNCEINIYRHYYTEDAERVDEDLTAIECEVVAANLLNLRFTMADRKTAKEYQEEMSYSGTFTIWWS